MFGLKFMTNKVAHARLTGSTWIACIFSGPDPWTRKSAMPSSEYVSSTELFSLTKFLYPELTAPCQVWNMKRSSKFLKHKVELLHGKDLLIVVFQKLKVLENTQSIHFYSQGYVEKKTGLDYPNPHVSVTQEKFIPNNCVLWRNKP